MPHIIQQYTEVVGPLAKTGAELVQALNGYLAGEELGPFAVVNKEQPLIVSYFGYKILFRVEIELKSNGSALGKVVAYSLSYDQQANGSHAETELASCQFNKLGNITIAGHRQGFVHNDFAPEFLAEIFNIAMKRGMHLRP